MVDIWILYKLGQNRSTNVSSTHSEDTHVLHMSFCSLVPLLYNYC